MKKYIGWNFIIVFFVLILTACNAEKPQPTITGEPTVVVIPTNTSAATIEILPEATLTPEPTEPPQLTNTPTQQPATETTVPTMVETEPTIGSMRISEIDQMEQVYVPAGEFLMGSDDDEAKRTIEGGRAYPEIPANTVYLDGYWIDKYEVTTGQYGQCVDAGVCRAPWSPGSDTRPSYFGNPEFADYPVIWINWFMAKGYCEWAGRRLPTEAEWEKAARGTDGRTYPWGNDPLSGERANFCDVNCLRTIANDRYDDGYADTAPVGSYPLGASPYGALDMTGNVWEWTASLISPYPYDAKDGREDPEALGERAWRGGPYSNGYWWMRVTVRYRSVTSYWWMNLGFRCASTK